MTNPKAGLMLNKSDIRGQLVGYAPSNLLGYGYNPRLRLRVTATTEVT